MKYLLLLAVLLGGCAGQIAEPTPEALECELYEVCKADDTGLTVCINGECACVASNPGENRARSCVTGEPDGTYPDPWAKK